MSHHTNRLVTGMRVAALAAFATLAVSGAAHAQLQVTEIMSDTLSPGDDAWEWIEVRNTGATPLDLNGYIIDRLGDATPTTLTPSINSAQAMNTVIPAGGVAVLYDADVSIAAADFNDGLFRTAWGLAPTVPLVGVSGGFGGGLTNGGGTAIGLWQDATAYNLDVADDGMGVIRVAQFNNAATSVDFRSASGFPAVGAGVSIAWNGTGSFQTGANWAATVTGTTSVPATVPGSSNSVADVANPGIVPGGTAAAGIHFTEIMYNPRSAEPNWEWVEVYNNTGATIDFSATPYVFDDDDDAALTAANLTSGIIPNGTAAVLFNASATGVTLSDMQAAWDPGGVRGINFIPLSASTAYTQGGDVLALWSSLAGYQGEAVTGQGRTTANAVSLGTYDNEAADLPGLSGVWPNDDGDGSIYLEDLSLDRTVGENWSLSVEADVIGSFNPAALAGTLTVHPGGDLGTPGAFSAGPPPTNNSDFDNDGDVDGADFLTWQANLGATGVPVGNKSTGDANGDGNVNAADLTEWQSHFGLPPAAGAAGSVPEPAAVGLATLAVAGLGLRRRR